MKEFSLDSRSLIPIPSLITYYIYLLELFNRKNEQKKEEEDGESRGRNK